MDWKNQNFAKMDKTDVIIIVKKYAELVRKTFDYQKIILFGSYASDNARKDSDIDIAVVFTDYNNRLDRQVELMKLTRLIDTRIEPHPFREKDFDHSNPLVNEIISHGMEVEG
jgi:predicted nucleotidyltransferase